MDVRMPVMDGLAAMRRMRAIEGLNAVPIIAVSAGAMSDATARSLAAGATAFLSKPVDHYTLIQTITRHLRLDWVDGKARKSVVSGKSVDVRVALGGRSIHKTK